MGATTNPRLTGINSEVRQAAKTITFTGAAGLGQVGAVPIFTVTGQIVVEKIVGYCSVDLISAGGGSLALGVTGSTALFIAATTATAIDVGEVWISNTPTAAGIAIPAACKDIAITANIIGTVATGDITAGAINIAVVWRPLSSDGNLE
jgi:hypothetical protein